MQPNVSTTKLLATIIGLTDTSILAQRFQKWRASGSASCPEDYYFGRDVPYAKPKLKSGFPLHHVHMVPLSNADDLKIWRAQINSGNLPTSDTALVYVQNVHLEVLLIAMLPQAHSVGLMLTPEHAKIMNHLAMIADEFVSAGSNNY